jgi:hypothetical protein
MFTRIMPSKLGQEKSGSASFRTEVKDVVAMFVTYVPRVIITDKLKSYRAAKREILRSVEHRQHRYLNNRVHQEAH